ncbi:MAG: hypothetical protein P8Y20_02275 [Gammaproteobacteria bacterium]|jgi:hypothetical protein
MYIYITGLDLQSPWKSLIFYSHAIPSLLKAASSRGNLSVEVKNFNGVKHTLSVWESEDDMKSFINSGSHKKAIEAFTRIAKDKMFGYDAQEIPDWSQVHKLWLNSAQN